ncbi:MAG: glutaredoxin family protein [Candidatus Bipolaricaulia bacterium]
MTEITVYSKPYCPVCHKAERVVRSLQGEFDFGLKIVDITKDPKLYEKYRYDIPVIAVDGVDRFLGAVDAAALQELLTLDRE